MCRIDVVWVSGLEFDSVMSAFFEERYINSP